MYIGESFGGKKTDHYFKNTVMRKVLYKKYVKKAMLPLELQGKVRDGSGLWDTEFTHEGLFHHWGNACEESDTGFGNYTIGLIELPDGTIEEVLPTNIKFLPQ